MALHIYILFVANSQHRLAKAASSEHGNESLVRLLDTMKLSVPRLDLTFSNPLGHSSPEAVNILRIDVLIPETESLNLDAAAENLRQVRDSVLLVNWLIVL